MMLRKKRRFSFDFRLLGTSGIRSNPDLYSFKLNGELFPSEAEWHPRLRMDQCTMTDSPREKKGRKKARIDDGRHIVWNKISSSFLIQQIDDGIQLY